MKLASKFKFRYPKAKKMKWANLIQFLLHITMSTQVYLPIFNVGQSVGRTEVEHVVYHRGNLEHPCDQCRKDEGHYMVEVSVEGAEDWKINVYCVNCMHKNYN